ncbi:glycosyltransferase family 2 protein [Actinotalea sp. BY-33]|uniref:4,4'-diaponeurosporenoate glycosyltransferase n=1 Tax=Actinotalea soli TaxID=2819234 RepID=A0A939LPL6_9CELL|nr:glycosyltransferase family A protein [Actinotalea soli]MBO1751981.1 glycosyltransferase family 2 protein [Actinotalea soli]
MADRATIVIPAHDEESVIERCLEVLLAGARPDDFDVVVVSNGSSDGTVARARAAADRLRFPVVVIDLDRPSKIAAIREGIDHAAGGPVVVLDADIELPTSTALAVCRVLGRAEPVLASARLRVDASRSSWWVRRYYRAWTALPYVSSSMVGSGVFALNAAALADIGALPDVTNDDGWVLRQFPVSQRVVVSGEFVAHAARTVSALVARRARIVNGNRELDQLRPPESDHGLQDLLRLARARVISLADLLAFVVVTVASRVLAARRRATGDRSWAADRTSRVPG